MDCKVPIKIVNDNDQEAIDKLKAYLLDILDAKHWKSIKKDSGINRVKLMRSITQYVYLPEEGKALTDEDKNHLQAVQTGINTIVSLNAFKNINSISS